MIWEVLKKIILSGIVSWIIYLVLKLIFSYKAWIMRSEVMNEYDYTFTNHIRKWVIALCISIFSLLIFLILFF